MKQLTALSRKRLGMTLNRKQFLLRNETVPLTVNKITQKKAFNQQNLNFLSFMYRRIQEQDVRRDIAQYKNSLTFNHGQETYEQEVSSCSKAYKLSLNIRKAVKVVELTQYSTNLIKFKSSNRTASAGL